MTEMISAKTNLNRRVASDRSNSKAGPKAKEGINGLSPPPTAPGAPAGLARKANSLRTSVSRAWKSMESKATKLLTNSMRDKMPKMAVRSAEHDGDESNDEISDKRTKVANTGRNSASSGTSDNSDTSTLRMAENTRGDTGGQPPEDVHIVVTMSEDHAGFGFRFWK